MNEIINLGNGQFVKVIMFKGERGSNIATITKTGTSGLVDTYTITLTDGSTTSFEVKNGSSIDYIAKTSSVGSVDTYTIYLTDGTVGGTFEVNNAIATVEQNFSSTSTNPLMNKTLTNIIAGVENGSTASKTYYANDLILRNDSLYEVSTTVAVGSAWADGVNISETTLGDLVSQINADLNDKVTIKTYTDVAIGNQYNFGGGSGNFGDKDITSEIALYGTPISIMAIESGGGNPCFCTTYESGATINARVVCLANYSASRKADITVVYSK